MSDELTDSRWGTSRPANSPVRLAVRPGCEIRLVADSIWRGRRRGADGGRVPADLGVLSAV